MDNLSVGDEEMLEKLLTEFAELERKIDDNMVVRQDILNKLNMLVTDMAIIKKDFYGNGKEGAYAKIIRHENYFIKLAGMFALLSGLFAFIGVVWGFTK